MANCSEFVYKNVLSCAVQSAGRVLRRRSFAQELLHLFGLLQAF